MTKKKILTCVGTRPEIIKLSATLPLLDQYFEHHLVHTGQNSAFELGDLFFSDLGLRKPDTHLGCQATSSAQMIAQVIERTDALIEKVEPEAFLIYGDTNSCMSAIAAKKRKIPIFHLEAGNRCFDQRVPEEVNRKLIDHLSDVNMVHSEAARRNLLAEGFNPTRIFKSGSPMAEIYQKQNSKIDESQVLDLLKLNLHKYIVVSLHREENVDDPERLKILVQVLREIPKLLNLDVVVSLHPRTKRRLQDFGLSLAAERVFELKPLGFSDYVCLQKKSACVLSDSGTISEESALLKIRAVQLRQSYERPEAFDSGVHLRAVLTRDEILRSLDLCLKMNVPSEAPSDYLAADF
jgi:UDP-N-acetylglucosamine 2-epimerase